MSTVHAMGVSSPLVGSRQRLVDYLELAKPRVTGLVLLTVVAGFWVGLRSPAQWPTLIPLLLGTALAVGGANTLNQWSEREADGLMERTKSRPLPAGRLPAEEARRAGLVLSVVGVLILALGVNLLTAWLTTFSIATYVLLYTPLKQRTTLCTLIGAVPGALPPMIGWAGARDALGIGAWALFVMLFLWQLPHFLAIAVLYREDYTRAGFRMLPVGDTEGLATARQTVLYGIALVPASVFPSLIGLAGPGYFYAALAVSLWFLAISLRAALVRSVPAMQQLFRASVLYLPLLLGLLVWLKVR